MNDACVSETGRVGARHEDGRVEIIISGGSECAKCGMCKRAADATMRVEVRDPGGVEVGQAVKVTFPYRSRWRAILFAFTLPLGLFLAAGMGAGAAADALGATGPAATLGVLLSACGGLAGGLFIARGAEKRFRRNVFERTRVEPVEKAGEGQ